MRVDQKMSRVAPDGEGPPPRRPSLRDAAHAVIAKKERSPRHRLKTMSTSRRALVSASAGKHACSPRAWLRKGLYFHLLESGWGWLALAVASGYGLVLFAFTLISLVIADDLDGESVGVEGRLFTCAMFALENIVTMGWGRIDPHGRVAFVVGTLQHVTGIVLNVFSFTIVVTKFQHPDPDIVFASSVCIAQRDGVPHLLIRLGNKRCNLIYHPEIKVIWMTPVRTREGEQFVKAHSLDVQLPATISGVYTLAHRLDADSPLGEALKTEAAFRDCDAATRASGIQVVFVGRDGVYHDDLHFVKRYMLERDVVWDHRFGFVNERDARGGAFINFEKYAPLTLTPLLIWWSRAS